MRYFYSNWGVIQIIQGSHFAWSNYQVRGYGSHKEPVCQEKSYRGNKRATWQLKQLYPPNRYCVARYSRRAGRGVWIGTDACHLDQRPDTQHLRHSPTQLIFHQRPPVFTCTNVATQCFLWLRPHTMLGFVVSMFPPRNPLSIQHSRPFAPLSHSDLFCAAPRSVIFLPAQLRHLRSTP